MLNRRSLLAAAPALAFARPAGAAPATDPMTALFQEGRYLPLGARLAADPSYYPPSYYRAWIGDERGAFATLPKSKPLVCPSLEGAQARDALDDIVARASGRRVVILNEAHFASRDRLFALALALRLRCEGFDWFAAESINAQPGSRKQLAGAGRFTAETLPDDGWARPGNAVTPMSLDYSDPCYAALVRGVRGAGFRMFAYEMRRTQDDADSSIAARETAESGNLAALLAAMPDARVMIYCGFHHVCKTPIRGEHWMSARLRDWTKLEPLCVEQAWGAPSPCGVAEDPAITTALDRLRPTRPVSVRLKDGSPLTLDSELLGGVDVTVLHPRLPDVSGRPGWLVQAPGRREVRVALPHDMPDGALAQVAPVDELTLSAATIPADQYPLRAGAAEAVFFLSPGRYRVRVETLAGFTAVRDLTVAPQ